MSHTPFVPATQSTRRRDARLLVVAGSEEKIHHARIRQMGQFLKPGDVLVVNDAATMPASFLGTHKESGQEIELRLAAHLGETHSDVSTWLAVVFGEGDWHTPTEHRPAPPALQVGERLHFGRDLSATITMVSPRHGRLVSVDFKATQGDLWKALYAQGKPIQYSYLKTPLEVWDQQTIFSGSPIAVEPPSSGFQITWELILSLRKQGVVVAPITHATGLSTTGDEQLDRLLPFPERSFIPEKTAALINEAKAGGRQIIALGTGVTRALESAVLPNMSGVAAGAFVSREKLYPGYPRMVVDGLLTGLHEVGSSHLDLLGSFVTRDLLTAGYDEARELGYLGHEYGDACLIAT